VVDGTKGSVSRCEMHRALGRVLPPECGGTGRPGGETTRGRVVIGTPDQGTKPATDAPATAPATGTTASVPPAATTGPVPTPASPKGIGLLVPFALDSAELTPQAMRVVDQLAEVFKLNPGDRFVIEGHTDASGGEAYNQSLSERRAQAVIDYLVSRYHLPRAQFQGRGMGSAKLMLPNDPMNGRNRRVQVLNIGS
ncbi:MAG: OmpA family protein, partial [Alphaproteobacteria bacterium]|nr:OmpA family protein [Alphaproteobacteria bacterium]